MAASAAKPLPNQAERNPPDWTESKIAMAKQAPKMDVSSTGTGKLKYIDGGAVESARGAPARTGHWLAALLRRRFVKALIVANLVALMLLSLRETGWLQSLELSAFDTLVTFFAGSQQGDRVVLVVTTEEDINRLNYPIRDNYLAAVLAAVFASGPKAVGVDLYRDLPMAPGNQELQAIQHAHDNLYWVFKLPDVGNDGVPPPPALRGTGREVLSDHVTDAGSVVRRALLLASDERTNRNWPTMGVALAERYTGQRLRIVDNDLALGQGRIPVLDQPYGPYAKVDAAGYQMLLDYRGGYRRFRQISFSEIIGRPDLAATLRGRIVLIGTAALSIKDSFATPLSTGWGGEGPLVGIALHRSSPPIDTHSQWRIAQPGAAAALDGRCHHLGRGNGRRSVSAAGLARAGGLGAAAAGPWPGGRGHRLGVLGRGSATARRAGGAGLGAERGRLQLRHALGGVAGTRPAAPQLRELPGPAHHQPDDAGRTPCPVSAENIARSPLSSPISPVHHHGRELGCRHRCGAAG